MKKPGSQAVQRELASNECLQHVICTVTAHMEQFVERRVSEAHDGLAARIEDVVAAHVDRLRAEVLLKATRGDFRGKACCTGSLSEPETPTALHRSPTAEQLRWDSLEATVARVAATTARDMVALRTEIATELRGVGNSVKVALEQTMAELDSVKQSLAEVQRTTPGLKIPSSYPGSSVETDVTTPGSQRGLRSSAWSPSGQTFSSSSSGVAEPDACLSSESEGFATPRCNKAAAERPSPEFLVHGRDGRRRANTWRPRSSPPAGDFVRRAVSVLEKAPDSSGSSETCADK